MLLLSTFSLSIDLFNLLRNTSQSFMAYVLAGWSLLVLTYELLSSSTPVFIPSSVILVRLLVSFLLDA
ncbi:hypothetical protein LINPERPRIM_LOCUS20790 [Linum perenne]